VAGENHYQLSGKVFENDYDLGWSDHGMRRYDPAMGRWTSADPLMGVYADMSPYNYVMGNPVGLVDPDGAAPKGKGFNRFVRGTQGSVTFIFQEITVSELKYVKCSSCKSGYGIGRDITSKVTIIGDFLNGDMGSLGDQHSENLDMGLPNGTAAPLAASGGGTISGGKIYNLATGKLVFGNEDNSGNLFILWDPELGTSLNSLEDAKSKYGDKLLTATTSDGDPEHAVWVGTDNLKLIYTKHMMRKACIDPRWFSYYLPTGQKRLAAISFIDITNEGNKLTKPGKGIMFYSPALVLSNPTVFLSILRDHERIHFNDWISKLVLNPDGIISDETEIERETAAYQNQFLKVGAAFDLYPNWYLNKIRDAIESKKIPLKAKN
jgi:RHS repeat-associated protein